FRPPAPAPPSFPHTHHEGEPDMTANAPPAGLRPAPHQGIFEVPFGAPSAVHLSPRLPRRSLRTTRSQRTTIRIAYLLGRTLEDLAAQFNVSHVTVFNIVNGVGPRYAA